MGKEYPLTVENRWDILYRDYPEKYDEFATVGWIHKDENQLYNMYDFSGKRVADIGSGSGRSTFKLAPHATFVIGVEPEKSMRDLANKKLEEKGINNVLFIEGTAESIPLPDDSVDYVTAITAVMNPPEEAIPRFAAEAERVTKPGGTIIYKGVTPGWYGGELDHVIQSQWAIENDPISDNEWRKAGFRSQDYQVVQDYSTLEKIISVYGFIFGVKAIDYLREHNKTTVTWSYRWYIKQV
jgi:ubiquinone/menaquinone biosynthesis C-methylase UbiE